MSMNEKRIPVMEIFGPTVQGEGMVIGQKTMFVRTAGCDYRCSWCDSAFTWDGSGKDEIKLMTAQDIMRELRRIGGNTFAHVTLSGGNPALLRDLGALVAELRGEGIRTAVETQGSKWQDWLLDIDEVTLSPKPPSSGMSTDWSMLDHVVGRLTENGSRFSLKVVVFDEEDYQYAIHVHRRYADTPMFLQPGNADLTEMDNAKLLGIAIQSYERLVDRTMRSAELTDVRVLPQLHTWLWGNKRGV